jgi:hypothetical protein
MNEIGGEVDSAMFGKRLPKIGGMVDRINDSHYRLEGVVEKIYLTNRMPAVDVRLVNGGLIKFLPFPGGTIDEDTGNLHGMFHQPSVGQKVIVSFANASPDNPYISELIFRCGTADLAQLYKDFPDKYNIKEGDILIGHRSGRTLKLTDDAIYVAKDAGTYDRIIAFDKLSHYLMTVVGNLGSPIFPLGLPPSADIFF